MLSTFVRGAWCQALSLPRPPVLWSGLEEQQEVVHRRRQEEVAEDAMECSVQGLVEGLTVAEGENVVGFPPQELPMRH